MSIYVDRVLTQIKRWLLPRIGLQFRVSFYLDNPNQIPKPVARIGIHARHTEYRLFQHAFDKDPVTHTFPIRYIYNIKNCLVDTHNNLFYLESGNLIAESSSWPIQRLLWEVPVPRKKRRLFTKTIDGKCVYFPVSKNYYHWLFEDLPVFISALNIAKNAKVIIPRHNFSPAQEFIAKYLQNHKLIYASKYVLLKEHVFSAKTCGLGSPFGHNTAHPEDINILRSWFASEISSGSSVNGNEKIYVSRVGIRRSPKGESILVAKLAAHGYTIFDGRCSLFDQIRLFSNAKIVVGLSGAGMSNVVWIRASGAKIIQINNDSGRFLFYANIASYCGHEFREVNAPGQEWRANDVDALLKEILSLED